MTTAGTPGSAGELSPVGYRFALRRPVSDTPPAEPIPVGAPEPFGMRFFRPLGAVEDMAPSGYRYSSALQVAVTDDDDEAPLVTTIEAWDRTTTGEQDGHKGPSEEFKLDFCGDQ